MDSARRLEYQRLVAAHADALQRELAVVRDSFQQAKDELECRIRERSQLLASHHAKCSFNEKELGIRARSLIDRICQAWCVPLDLRPFAVIYVLEALGYDTMKALVRMDSFCRLYCMWLRLSSIRKYVWDEYVLTITAETSHLFSFLAFEQDLLEKQERAAKKQSREQEDELKKPKAFDLDIAECESFRFSERPKEVFSEELEHYLSERDVRLNLMQRQGVEAVVLQELAPFMDLELDETEREVYKAKYRTMFTTDAAVVIVAPAAVPVQISRHDVEALSEADKSEFRKCASAVYGELHSHLTLTLQLIESELSAEGCTLNICCGSDFSTAFAVCALLQFSSEAKAHSQRVVTMLAVRYRRVLRQYLDGRHVDPLYLSAKFRKSRDLVNSCCAQLETSHRACVSSNGDIVDILCWKDRLHDSWFQAVFAARQRKREHIMMEEQARRNAEILLARSSVKLPAVQDAALDLTAKLADAVAGAGPATTLIGSTDLLTEHCRLGQDFVGQEIQKFEREMDMWAIDMLEKESSQTVASQYRSIIEEDRSRDAAVIQRFNGRFGSALTDPLLRSWFSLTVSAKRGAVQSAESK